MILNLNLTQELNSFPLTQRIKLQINSSIEEKALEESIVLFRLPKASLINLSEKYAYNLGHIKETFDVVPVTYEKVSEIDEITILDVIPTLPLNPNSHYCLYISKKLPKPFISLQKLISSSNSTLDIDLRETNIDLEVEYTVKITSSPSITETTNIISGEITNNLNNNVETFNLNLKNKTKLSLDTFHINFTSLIYDFNETFKIALQTKIPYLEEDFLLTLQTVSTESIRPLQNLEASTAVTNEDILNFYQGLNETPVEVPPLTIEYYDLNVLKIILPDNIIKSNIDTVAFNVNLKIAFNNYQLKKLNLYKDDLKYNCKILWDEGGILLVFTYVEPELQVELLTLDWSEW